MLALLQRIVEAAELQLVSVADDAMSVVCRSPHWLDQDIEVAATSEDLSASSENAAREAKHLWPSRGDEWGAVALLSAGLRSTVDARTSAPVRVVLERHGGWVAHPPEEIPGDTSNLPGVKREWVASSQADRLKRRR